MSTTTVTSTYQSRLNTANPNELPDLLRKMRLGNFAQKVKVVFAGLTSASAFDITTAASKAAATITGITLADGEYLPAIRNVVSLRVVTTGGTVGPRVVTDAGGTAAVPGANGPGIALLSDDGKTITFDAAVTAFTLVYEPQSAVDLTSSYP